MSTSDSWFDMKTAWGTAAAAAKTSIREGIPQRTRSARDHPRAKSREIRPRGGTHDVRRARVAKTTVVATMTPQPQIVARRSLSARRVTAGEFTGRAGGDP